MKAVVAERGQVTIPITFREQLGLKKGTILNFELKGSALSITKEESNSAIRQVYGCLKKLNLNTDAVMRQLRGEE